MCSVDFVGVYPNILHEEDLSALQKRLELKTEKEVSTTRLVKLAEVVLKNIAFTFGKQTLKQLSGTAIGTNFAPPYNIISLAKLVEAVFMEAELKPNFGHGT